MAPIHAMKIATAAADINKIANPTSATNTDAMAHDARRPGPFDPYADRPEDGTMACVAVTVVQRPALAITAAVRAAQS